MLPGRRTVVLVALLFRGQELRITAQPSPTPAPTFNLSRPLNETEIVAYLEGLHRSGTDVPFCTIPNVEDIKKFCSLKGAYCGAMSRKHPEPELCYEGRYCVTSRRIQECPTGHYCPLGVAEPFKCSHLFSRLACQHSGLAYPSLFWVFLVVFLLLIPVIVLAAYIDIRARRRHLRRALQREATIQEELQDKIQMLEAAKCVQHVVAVTIAGRMEDDLISRRPLERFRRAVRDVIRLMRELKARRTPLMWRPGDTALGSVVTKLSRQVQRLSRFEEISEPLTISFEKLSLTVGKTRVIHDLSGSIYAKTTCALMGPSGAGKTSLLTLLRGRAHYGKITGGIAVNGRVVASLAEYADHMGFVPQEDVMYEELTVEENIFFSCLLFSRKDAWANLRDTRLLVNDVIVVLGLHKVRNSVIGNAEVRGISGGQRKRVSVGMELVKGPRILFLDEPTSGLDSSTSVALMETLSALASFGLTITATIHQPRYEIFEKMSDVILLAPGGRMVYCGPTRLIEKYFNQLGYPCPAKVNVADYVMDVLSGLAVSSQKAAPGGGGPGLSTAEKVQDQLVEQWPSQRQGFESRGAASASRNSRRRTQRLSRRQAVQQTPPMGALGVCRTQVTFVGYRQLQCFARSWRTVLVDLLSLYIVGGIVGLLFGPMTIGTSALPSQVMVLELAYGFLTSSAALRTFGSDRVIYLREEASGIMILPYFLGKFVGTVPSLFLQPAAFLLSFYSLAQPQQSSTHFYGTLWVLSFVVYAVGGLVGASVGNKSQSTAMTCITVLLWCANGVTLKPADLIRNFGTAGRILYTMSYFRFTSQAIVVGEFRTFSPAVAFRFKRETYRRFGLADSMYDSSWKSMLLYGLLVHLTTILFLYWRYNDYELWRRLCKCMPAWSSTPLSVLMESVHENSVALASGLIKRLGWSHSSAAVTPLPGQDPRYKVFEGSSVLDQGDVSNPLAEPGLSLTGQSRISVSRSLAPLAAVAPEAVGGMAGAMNVPSQGDVLLGDQVNAMHVGQQAGAIRRRTSSSSAPGQPAAPKVDAGMHLVVSKIVL